MRKFSSFSEAANEARKLAMESKQPVRISRNQNRWVISTYGQNVTAEQAKPDDLEAIFSRSKGDYDSDYDTEPPF